MHLMYLMAIEAATRSIDMAASYFVPDPLAIKALLAARQRGVRVRILLPGKHIDSETVRIASKAAWGPLLLAGVEILEIGRASCRGRVGQDVESTGGAVT